MARRVVGIGILFLALLGWCGLAAADGGGEDAGRDLEKKIAALREKAHALREKGSVEDAEHVAKRAELLERVQALRRQSNELERRGKDLKVDGRIEEATRAMEESGRLWKESEAILSKVDEHHAKRKHVEEARRQAEVEAKVQAVTARRAALHGEGKGPEADEVERLLALLHAAAGRLHDGAARHSRHYGELVFDAGRNDRAERVRKAIGLLRESGLGDLAALVERETKEITQPPKPAPPPAPFVVMTGPVGDANAAVASLREEVQALRRQMEELRAVLRELRQQTK